MAGINELLAGLDRLKRMAGRRMSDLASDPLGVVRQQVDDLRNTQRGVEPVAGPQGLGMRQIPREEQVSRMTQQALDTYGGGLGMLGHTVFHGSPHRFTKFDKSRMGTGEGNQAFGKGVYVAENPAVAESYRNAGLSVVPDNATYGGRKIQSLYDAAQRKQDLGHRTKNQAMIDDANAELYFWESILTGTHPSIIKSNALDPDNGWPGLAKFASSLDDRKFKGVAFPESSLYKVDIPDEAVPRMLDWEAAIRDQPPDVLAALKRIGVAQPDPAAREAIDAAKAAFNADKTRENYAAMQALINQGQNLTGKDIISRRLASEADLENAGITGVRYLDADSRAGGGTRNMVVFNPDLMRIIERNGEPTGLQPWGLGEWQGGSTLEDLAKVAREPTEFELRHATAQRNAALPVEQGGLGLGPQNTAQERAAAMGFERGWVHGSPRPDLVELRPSKIGAEGRGAYVTDYAQEAGTYAGGKEGATNYPLMVNRGRTLNTGAGADAYSAMKADTDDELAAALRAGGFDSITATQPQTPQWLVDAGAPSFPQRRHFVSENPANFRSPFAAFDPARRHEADMLGFIDPRLLAGMAVGGGAMMGYDPSYLPDSFRQFASILRQGR